MNDWFEHILFHARTRPEISAVLMEDRVVTYGMLGAAIENCARRIAALDFATEGLAAVCIQNPIRHLTLSLALYRIGIRAISLERAHHAIPGLKLVLVLGDAEAKQVFASPRHFVEVTDDWFGPNEIVSSAPLPAPFSGDRQVCRYSLTSGSTGEPKLLDNTVGFFGRGVVCGLATYNCHSVLCMPGLTTAYGMWIACTVLASRKTLCLAVTPFQAIRMIDLFGIDFIYSATEQLVSLVRAARKSRSRVKSLRTVSVAGGIPTRALLEAAAVHLCKDILCRYGTSEVGLLAEAPASEVLARPGLIGSVLPGFEMAVRCERRPMPSRRGRHRQGPGQGEPGSGGG